MARPPRASALAGASVDGRAALRTWLAGYLRDESWVDRDERTNVQVARAWLAAEGRPSSAE